MEQAPPKGHSLGFLQAAVVRDAVDEVLEALKVAAAKAPADGRSAAGVAARVIADMIDRASLQFAMLAREPGLEPYLDGYGFFRAAERRAAESLTAIAAVDKDAGAAIKEALERKGITIKHVETRMEAKCGKCGAPNRVSAAAGQTRVPFTCKECGHKQRTL